jgi:hypothetical protein
MFGLGFSFHETMSGTYHLLAAPLDERAITFSAGARVAGLSRFMKDKMARLSGEITVEGFADRRPFEGTLALRLLDEQRLTYSFSFVGNDGQSYRFHGQKDVMLIALVDTMTTLPASLYDASGKEVGRAVLRFDIRGDLGTFVRSFRPRFRQWTA